MNLDNFDKELLKHISMIPGVYGFADLNSKNENLEKKHITKKNEWYKAISKIQHSNEIIINLAVVILFSVNTQTIVKEISSLVEFYTKKNNFKLKALNIHIKGVS
ncbi:hypothetical protein [Mesomycoplasma neurolyticum]|uniref:Uncharacterized protein n=1 Tax=Mesomycoplasma neurolyticum TaxID=2120 RepID=A0A449A545_9BACT|nr:hypothetical protein [Mesomycoplasma neurolyticum]VEU59273.1 Uncharacterised protein [Mesomycoplasma neurolyticum]